MGGYRDPVRGRGCIRIEEINYDVELLARAPEFLCVTMVLRGGFVVDRARATALLVRQIPPGAE